LSEFYGPLNAFISCAFYSYNLDKSGKRPNNLIGVPIRPADTLFDTVSRKLGPKALILCILGGITLFGLVEAIVGTTQLAPGSTIATRICLLGVLAMLDSLLVLYAIGIFTRRLRAEHEQMVETSLQFAHRLALAIEMRDPCTPGHNDRVGRYCSIIAQEMGLEPEFCEHIYYAAPFHDVGKICVPDEILNKPGPLTDRERDIMERHVELGAMILENSDDPIVQLACSIVSTHHELWDGSGYPLGLKGEEIPIEGRITAACDVFDALMSSRPYKEPWPVGRAIEEIKRNKGTRFDPRIVEAMEKCVYRLITVDRDVTANTKHAKRVKLSDARAERRPARAR
jgi:HD-GYP domain-containing protein (c-di-GMP phosphodiesterase class II)